MKGQRRSTQLHVLQESTKYINTHQQKLNIHVELELGSGHIRESTYHSDSEVKGSTTLIPPPVVPQYSIAKDRFRGDIRPLQRYGEGNLVTYALRLTECIKSSEKLSIYLEGVNYDFIAHRDIVRSKVGT